MFQPSNAQPLRVGAVLGSAKVNEVLPGSVVLVWGGGVGLGLAAVLVEGHGDVAGHPLPLGVDGRGLGDLGLVGELIARPVPLGVPAVERPALAGRGGLGQREGERGLARLGGLGLGGGVGLGLAAVLVEGHGDVAGHPLPLGVDGRGLGDLGLVGELIARPVPLGVPAVERPALAGRGGLGQREGVTVLICSLILQKLLRISRIACAIIIKSQR